MMGPVRILHVHSTFTLGGKEARAIRLMNAFGNAARHTVISATGALDAREAISEDVKVAFPDDHPPIVGKPALRRYRALAHYMSRFDLVLTYNWGSMDAVGARRLFGGPPLVHHEDGFNQDEVDRQKLARVLFRWLMLPAARHVVVPSHTLERIARETWKQPVSRVVRIANGIPLPSRSAVAIPGFEPRKGELVVGTIAGLRAVKNIPRLVRAFAAGAPETARLLVMGEGPERTTVMAEAERLGIAGRVLLPGFVSEPARAIRHCAIFALSSDSEQQPISLIEAMAASLPAVSTDVGDVRAMVASDNVPFIVPAADEAGFASAIRTLAANPDLRGRIGAANYRKATTNFAESAMISTYRALYAGAIGRRGAFG